MVCIYNYSVKEGGKPENPEKNPRSTGEMSYDNSIHMSLKFAIQHGGTPADRAESAYETKIKFLLFERTLKIIKNINLQLFHISLSS